MDRFDIAGLEEWQHVAPGELLLFETAGAHARGVKLRVNAAERCAVYASYSEDDPGVLVGAFDGIAELRFTVSQPAYVRFDAGDGGAYVSGSAASHVVPAVADEVFTTVEPSRRRNGDLERMMMIMRLNEQRRERRLADELAALREERAASAELQAAGSAELASDGSEEVPADATASSSGDPAADPPA